MKEQARAKARQLAQEFAQRGDATGWFEELYTQAQGNEQAIHWADMEVNPNLVEWLDRRNIQGKGKLALVLCRGRSAEEPPGNLPWPLSTEELDVFKGAGLLQVHFEDYFDQEGPPVRRFRVEYQRASTR